MLSVPLSPETRHLIGAAELALMKPTAFLVNVARGRWSTSGLVEALARVDSEAKLDVFEEEPKVHSGLLGLENLALTPHIGSASRATRLKMATRAAENCLAALEGRRPTNLVNPEAWRSAPTPSNCCAWRTARGRRIPDRRQRLAVRVTIDPRCRLGHTARPITVVLDAPAANLAAVEVRVAGRRRPVLSEDLTLGREPDPAQARDAGRRCSGCRKGRPRSRSRRGDTLWRPRPPRDPVWSTGSPSTSLRPKPELKSATGHIKHAGAGIVSTGPRARRARDRVGTVLPGVTRLTGSGPPPRTVRGAL